MIPFRKTLAFRLLALSFILLALPLLVDSFVIIQKSYQNAIENAKDQLVKTARSLEVSLELMEPISKPFLILVERFLDLESHFPQKTTPQLNKKLEEMAHIGNLDGIIFLKNTQDNQYVVVASSHSDYIGWDYTNLVEMAVAHTSQPESQEYFDYLYYDWQDLSPHLIVGKVVYGEDHNRVGIILVYQNISEDLQKFLKKQEGKYTINLALLFPDSVVFAASDPALQYQRFETLSFQNSKTLKEQEPIATSYSIGYPFFTFSLNKQTQIAYIDPIFNTGYSLLVYASKYEIYAAPFYTFLGIFSVFLIILCIGGFVAYLLTRRMAKPLNSLTSVMLAMQKGDQNSRYPYDPFGFEINDLGNIFNEMIDTLLQKKQQAEKERIKRETLAKELQMGQEIQRSLLPRIVENYPDADVASVYIPAKNVGGDFYGAHVPIQQGELVLAIADAAGKGVQACFYSLGVRSLLRSFIREYNDVARVMTEANNLFCKDTRDSGMFITVLLGFYDRKTKILSYYSCGHNPGMVRRKNGEIEMLYCRDIAMGIMPLKEGKADKIVLETGDYVFFYTDGIPEAHNEDFEQFGEERLIQYLKGVDGESAKEIADGLVKEVNNFVGMAPQHDDITLLIMHVL